MKMLKWTAAAMVAMCVAAIAPHDAHAQSDVRPQRPRQERNRIRADEIARANAGSVYQLIQARRGMWLMRGTQSTDLTGTGSGKMLVYLDGAKLDGLDDLRQIPAAGVRMVEFLTPGETEHKLGEYTTIGTIRVVTRDEPQADSAHGGHR